MGDELFSTINPGRLSDVISIIWQNADISRVELAQRLNLEKSSVTMAVAALLKAGLVFETRKLEGLAVQVGRKRIGLRVKSDLCCFLGVELQPSGFKAVVVDLSGKVLHQQQAGLDFPVLTLGQQLALVYDRLFHVIRNLEIPLAAIGVGVPGLVNTDTGNLVSSVPWHASDWSVESVPNPWGVPVTLENDAKCCSWSVLLNEAAADHPNFMSLLLEFQNPGTISPSKSGAALGLSLVIGGTLVHHRGAREIGDFRGFNWKSENQNSTGLPDSIMALAAQDQDAQDCYLTEILLNLIPLVSTMAPERIVLFNDAASVADRIRWLVQGPLKESWLAKSNFLDKLEVSPMGNYSVAFGAAARYLVSMVDIKKRNQLWVSSTESWDWTAVFPQLSPETKGPVFVDVLT